MRAVVDTNVLVSGLMAAASPPGRVVAAVVNGVLRLQLCEDILAEYSAVLPRPQLRLPPDRVAELLKLIAQTADWVPVPAYAGTPPLPDPSDWPFMACALAAGCPVVTGNLKHFPAGCGVRVMTAREWVEGQSGTG
jgi:predicted nucleic acid-binding protein